MKTLLTILISLISLIGFGQNVSFPYNNYDWYIKEYENQLDEWRNPLDSPFNNNKEFPDRIVYYDDYPEIYWGLDSIICYLTFKEGLFLWNEYSQECYADSVKVCVFNCYMKYNDKKWEWAEFDCEYYQIYVNYYHCGEPYYKWTHPNEPNFPDFMKWLEGKLK